MYKDYAERQRQRHQANAQAEAKQIRDQKLTALLDLLNQNRLEFNAFPLEKDFNDYNRGQWVRVWDYVNEKLLTPTNKKVHACLETAIKASEEVQGEEYSKLVTRLKSLVVKFDHFVHEILEPHNDAKCYTIYEDLRIHYQEIIPLTLLIKEVIIASLTDSGKYQAPNDTLGSASSQHHTNITQGLFCDSDQEDETDEEQSSASDDGETALLSAFTAVSPKPTRRKSPYQAPPQAYYPQNTQTFFNNNNTTQDSADSDAVIAASLQEQEDADAHQPPAPRPQYDDELTAAIAASLQEQENTNAHQPPAAKPRYDDELTVAIAASLQEQDKTNVDQHYVAKTQHDDDLAAAIAASLQPAVTDDIDDELAIALAAAAQADYDEFGF